jgi:hypothetical protein
MLQKIVEIAEYYKVAELAAINEDSLMRLAYVTGLMVS